MRLVDERRLVGHREPEHDQHPATVIGVLERLARMDRTKVFLATLAVALVGLFVPGVLGALILYAVVAALAWLLAQTWVITGVPLRVFRLVMLAGWPPSPPPRSSPDPSPHDRRPSADHDLGP